VVGARLGSRSAGRLPVWAFVLSRMLGPNGVISNEEIITDDPIVAARIRDELQSLTSTEFVLLRFSDALTNEEAKDESPAVQ
jgi:hypothetical protein